MGEPARVVLLEPIADAAMLRLGRAAEIAVLDSADAATDQELRRADALIVRSMVIGADLLDRCPNVSVIGRHGAGLDNIDLDLAAERDITVVSTPRANAISVAEFTVTAALVLLKRLVEAAERLRSGELSLPGRSLPSLVQQHGLLGRELSAITVGVIGYGAIGRGVAQRFHALGSRVVGYDPYVDPATVPAELSWARELSEVLTADVVTVHVPMTGDRPLLDAEAIGRMRPGAVLINTSRAGLVDSHALALALTEGRLAAAAVDVFDPEPPLPDNPLLRAPNVLATPHMAAMTREAIDRMGEEVVDQVLLALAARPVRRLS